MTGYLGRFAREFKKSFSDSNQNAQKVISPFEPALIYNELPPFDVLPGENSPKMGPVASTVFTGITCFTLGAIYGLSFTVSLMYKLPGSPIRAIKPDSVVSESDSV